MLWLIEENIDASASLYSQLEGAFAIRRIASMDSLKTLVRLSGRLMLPRMILVNCCETSTDSGCRDLQDLPVSIADLVYCWQEDTPEPAGTGFRKTIACSKGQIAFRILEILESYSEIGETQPYKVDLSTHKLRSLAMGHEVDLSTIEARILSHLLEADGSMVSKENLKLRVWQRGAVANRTVDSHMSRLRKKLEETHLEVESVYGQGYRLRDARFFSVD